MNELQPRLYRPAWFLRLFVRLDDFGMADDSDAQDGAKPYKNTKAQKAADTAIVEAQIARLAASGSGTSQAAMAGMKAMVSSLRRSAAKGGELSSAGDSGKEDEYSVQFITAPLELTIEDKGFRDADTLEATFPFTDMPLFPLVVREIRVEGWVGTVKAEDFATPERWHLEPRMSKNCVLRFNGYVDPAEMESDETSSTVHIKARSYISTLIDGKINQHAKAYRPAADEPITKYINRILSLYPPTSGTTGGSPFRAYWYASPGNQEPILSRRSLLRSMQTAASRNQAAGQSPTSDVSAQQDPAAEAPDPQGQGDAAKGGSTTMPPRAVSEDGMSIWDLITQACELCGVIPMYKPSLPPFQHATTAGSLMAIAAVGGPNLSNVVPGGAQLSSTVDPANCLLVTPPEAFLDDISRATKIVGGARDGFSRELSDESGTFQTDVRFMVWGHNLSKMKLARHMGKVRPTAVEVRAYNPDASNTLRVMSARFPLHNPKKKGKGGGKSASKMTEKGGGKIDVVRTFVMKGIRDQGALERAAVSIYHQLTRAELTMELETDELASYIDPVASQQAGSLVENHNDNPDILRLCAGTPVHVTVARKSTEGADFTISSLSEFYDLKANNIVEILTKQNDRWGAFRTDGSTDQGKIEETARKIQSAYRSAKLPSVYYCRGIRLQFKADDTFFHATMELANYMPSNDPANLDETSRAMNDVRKKKPANAAAKKKSAQDKQTATVVDRAARQSAPISSAANPFTSGGTQ